MQYLVVGSGISGIAACELLYQKKESFILYDENTGLDIEALIKKHPFLSEDIILTGELADAIYEKTDVLVLSPGVPTDKPFVKHFKEKGVMISGEVELAYSFGRGKVVAITGTNGKTTTTSLVGDILKRKYADVHVVGNIGIPYTSVAAETTDETMVVAEISSFQLETASTFAPKVSAILNITPDHLDRHHTMANYIAAKESITKNQRRGDVVVLNYDDDKLRRFGKEEAPCEVVWFSGSGEIDQGYLYEDGALYRATDGKRTELLPTDELQILGRHNYENALAAWAIAAACGVADEDIAAAMRAFSAVPHRIQFICEKRGVRFYNDSKGTNPDAAIKAVEAMERPTHLIGGGYDKHSSYDAWIESFGDKVKTLALIGETKEAIRDAAVAHGFSDVVLCDTLEEAMDACFLRARDGDAVLLSPACASWDMFKNYEVRGEQFVAHARAYD